MTTFRPAADQPGHTGPPPASTAAAQALSRLIDIARVSAHTLASLTRQSVDLAWSTLAGSLDRASTNRVYVESMTREGARYWREVGRLSVYCAGDLVELGKSVSNTVLRDLAPSGLKPDTRPGSGAAVKLASVSRESPAPRRDEGERWVEGSLHGPVGGRAEGRITVANQHPRPRRILVRAGDLVDSAGAVVCAGLDISPRAVTVPSGQERSVNLGVDLDDSSFSAGERYSCAVEVSGGEEAKIEVSIQVSA